MWVHQVQNRIEYTFANIIYTGTIWRHQIHPYYSISDIQYDKFMN